MDLVVLEIVEAVQGHGQIEAPAAVDAQACGLEIHAPKGAVRRPPGGAFQGYRGDIEPVDQGLGIALLQVAREVPEAATQIRDGQPPFVAQHGDGPVQGDRDQVIREVFEHPGLAMRVLTLAVHALEVADERDLLVLEPEDEFVVSRRHAGLV